MSTRQIAAGALRILTSSLALAQAPGTDPDLGRITITPTESQKVITGA